MARAGVKKDRRTYAFTLLLEGADVTDDEVADAIHTAGCADALFGARDSVQYGDFDREADSLATAVVSAVDQIESVPGLRVRRVEPDELVTASVIAARTGRSRESIRLLAAGRRGPGGFPAPVAWVDAKTRLWEWSNVVRWFSEAIGTELSTSEGAEFLAALNAALEVRRRVRDLQTDDERSAVARVLP